MKPDKKRSKLFNPCFVAIRKLPLSTSVDYERFRLPDDGRKWLYVAQLRYQILLHLASTSKADGSFIGTDPKTGKPKDYSPGEKLLYRRFPSRASFYRRTNELRDLGLLSWTRLNHQSQRSYRIHLENLDWTAEQIAAFYVELVPELDD
jgi:hypothetical protein